MEKSLPEKLDASIFVFLLLFIAFSQFTIAGTQSTLGILFVLWIVKMIVKKQNLFLRIPLLDRAFLIFAAACIVATIFSIKPAESLVNLKNLLLIAVVYILGLNLSGKKNISLVIDVFVATSAVIAAFGLLTTDLMGGARVRALQSVTMTWGAMSALCALVTLSMVLFGGKGRRRWLYLLAFGVQFSSMLFSYVRGAWMGFIAGILVLAFLKNKLLVLAAFIVLILVFVAAPESVQNRISSITDLNVNSTRVRLVQWSNAVKIFQDYPVTGVGWIDLNEIHRAYAPFGADLSRHEYNIGHFHNNYIMFLIYLGSVGFLAALFMIFTLFQIVYKIYRRVENRFLQSWAVGTFAALACFWVNGLFDWTFGDAEPATLLWILVGISVAIGFEAFDMKFTTDKPDWSHFFLFVVWRKIRKSFTK
ncbi:O-antigen ligase family protein [candidate division KSB1 bacterium]|nr:O-antigen ligase family protein [candidate division KSB1 bacterium]